MPWQKTKRGKYINEGIRSLIAKLFNILPSLIVDRRKIERECDVEIKKHQENGARLLASVDEMVQTDELRQAIIAVLTEAVTCETEEELGKTCLAVAEKLTDSKFGFIGEINAAGLMDDIAISNPGWEACQMAVSDARRYIKNMPIRGIDRSTIRNGESRIVNQNEMATHPNHIESPEGHPEITAFLGVPLRHKGKVIGMIGLGNKETGYKLADQEAVEKLSIAIVQSLMRMRR